MQTLGKHASSILTPADMRLQCHPLSSCTTLKHQLIKNLSIVFSVQLMFISVLTHANPKKKQKKKTE